MRIALRLAVVVLAVEGMAVKAGAQRATSIHAVGCGDYSHHANGLAWQVPCTSEGECDRLLAEHYCAVHGQCGSGGGSVSSGSSRERTAEITGKNVAYAGVNGALLGAVVGTGTDGGPAAGAVLGAGVFMAITLTDRGLSPNSRFVAGVVSLTAIGAGVGMVEKVAHPDDPTKSKNTLRDTGIGAAAGLIVFGAKRLIADSKLSRFPLSGRLSRVQLFASGRQAGLGIRWR